LPFFVKAAEAALDVAADLLFEAAERKLDLLLNFSSIRRTRFRCCDDNLFEQANAPFELFKCLARIEERGPFMHFVTKA